MKHIITTSLLSLTAVLMLAGCAEESKDDAAKTNDENHEHMHEEGSKEVPATLKEATNPTFPVGSEAMLKADHMEGMEGATAKISGAYDTTVYAVTYTPTDGGAEVKNHKWVIHEELHTDEEAPLQVGTEVTLKADHMKGMDGATATIDSATNTTVYKVDYTSTAGDMVMYHKWVIEDELSAQ